MPTVYLFISFNLFLCFIRVAQALCMLSRYNPCVFQNVLEKVGQPKVLVSMSLPVVKIQQAIITMFVGLAASEACACHFLQDKVVHYNFSILFSAMYLYGYCVYIRYPMFLKLIVINCTKIK